LLDVCSITITITPKLKAITNELGGTLAFTLTSMNTMSMPLLLFGTAIGIPIVFLIASMMGLRIKGFGSGRMALQVPLIGPVLRRAETARFASHLSLLLRNHIPLAECLGLISESSENSYLRAAINDFHQRYQSGEKLGGLVPSQPLFPTSMAARITTAEDQGALSDTLESLGQYYRERTSHGLTILMEIFEPIMLILIGLLVSLILLSVYLPLFNIPGMLLH
jgi:type IV pilus assembly protein PilC